MADKDLYRETTCRFPARDGSNISGRITVEDDVVWIQAAGLAEDAQVCVEQLVVCGCEELWEPLNISCCPVCLDSCRNIFPLTIPGVYRLCHSGSGLEDAVVTTRVAQSKTPINLENYLMSCKSQGDRVSVTADPVSGCVTILVVPAEGTPSSNTICPGDNVECAETGIRINGVLCPFPAAPEFEVTCQDDPADACYGIMFVNGEATNCRFLKEPKVLPEDLHVPATINSPNSTITWTANGVDNQTFLGDVNIPALVSGDTDNSITIGSDGKLHVEIPAPTVDTDQQLVNPRFDDATNPTELIWDVYDNVSGTVISQISIDISSLISSPHPIYAAGDDISISGTGTTADPFVIAGTPHPEYTGGVGVDIAGTGTTADPYVVSINLCELTVISDADRDAATDVKVAGCVDGASVLFNMPAGSQQVALYQDGAAQTVGVPLNSVQPRQRFQDANFALSLAPVDMIHRECDFVRLPRLVEDILNPASSIVNGARTYDLTAFGVPADACGVEVYIAVAASALNNITTKGTQFFIQENGYLVQSLADAGVGLNGGQNQLTMHIQGTTLRLVNINVVGQSDPEWTPTNRLLVRIGGYYLPIHV